MNRLVFSVSKLAKVLIPISALVILIRFLVGPHLDIDFFTTFATNKEEGNLADFEDEYYQTGLTCYKSGIWTEAYGNFTLSWKGYNDSIASGVKPKVDEYVVVDYLAYSSYALGKYHEAVFFSRYALDKCQFPDKYLDQLNTKFIFYDALLKLLNLQPEIKEMASKSEAEQSETALKIQNLHFYEFCRDENETEAMKKLSENPQLFCRLDNRNRHPMLILAPIKEEIFSLNPLLVLQRNVISDREIEIFKTKSQGKMKQSGLDNQFRADDPNYLKFQRHASVYFMGNSDFPEISKRLQVYTNLDQNEKSGASEVLQIGHYPIGGHHVNHYDYTSTIPDSNGNRLATALLYLNDVEKGGSTIFPDLKVNVKPEKGALLLWFNLHLNGNGNPKMLHGACPVIHGEKWIGVTVVSLLFLKTQ